MNVKLVKLISGEEIIADIKGDNASDGTHFVRLVNPIVLVPTSQGNKMVSFPRFSLGTPIEIRQTHIQFITDVAVDALEAYGKAFGNIIVASSIEIPPTE